MRVRVSVRPYFFSFNISVFVCVLGGGGGRVSVFILAFFPLYFFIMVYIFYHNLLNFRYN